jgi:hypothetical protein
MKLWTMALVFLAAACSSSSSNSPADAGSATKTCADLNKCCDGLSDPAKSSCTAAVNGKNDAACASFYTQMCTGDGGAGGGDGGGGDGGSLVFCNAGASTVHLCFQTSDSATCEGASGAVVAACPTASLIGCCTKSGSATCYYSDGEAGAPSDPTYPCVQGGGTWTGP